MTVFASVRILSFMIFWGLNSGFVFLFFSYKQRVVGKSFLFRSRAPFTFPMVIFFGRVLEGSGLLACTAQGRGCLYFFI